MAENMMPIEVHADVAKHHPKEFVEAVIADAMKILPSYQHRPDTLVVITPRKIAVILAKQARRGAVIPAEMIEQIVEGKPKEKLQTWLAAPASPFYVMHIAGSWFAK